MNTLRAAAVAMIIIPLVLMILDARRKNRRRAAAMVQACWDRHVTDAIQLSETPIYDALALESARDIDTEWHAAATTGWAAP